MSKKFDFYVKREDGLVPFRFYISKRDNGNSCSYHHLNRDEQKELLSNKWRVLKYCGKEFLANEGDKDEVKASPNDVVVIAHKFSFKRLLVMMASLFALSLFLSFVSYVICSDFNIDKWMNVGVWANAVILFLACISYFQCLEVEVRAKVFNEGIIPEEKLK